MFYLFFSWWNNDLFRAPTASTRVKVATAGKAIGYWDGKTNDFQFKLPSVVCTADITFVGTSGVHKFYFSSNTANASHVKWEDMDYDFDNEAFQVSK